MGEKEIAIDYRELQRIEIYCDCGAGIILDVTKQYALPKHCSACNREFPEAAVAALVAYQRFQREAAESKLNFQFRAKAP